MACVEVCNSFLVSPFSAYSAVILRGSPDCLPLNAYHNPFPHAGFAQIP
jgi:hypothetical protein